MKFTTQLVVGALTMAAIAAVLASYLAAQPTTSPPAAKVPAVPASAQRRLPECPEALGANPLGGPCIPRTLRDAPPDPGPDNDKTLAGIDANRNGVRDDVERYILENFGESPEMIIYLFQSARATAAFASTRMTTAAQALDHANARVRASACASALTVGEDRPFSLDESRRLDDMFAAAQEVTLRYLNTTQRLDLYVKNEQLLAGRGISLSNERRVEALCDFVHMSTMGESR
ncbi:MAG: hypothetical protein MUC68_16115 [Burkholderiaceae bacterium]|jgi:hypothetical protein|nr:hypothetical protein [Burkholderiaceae bacterium]